MILTLSLAPLLFGARRILNGALRRADETAMAQADPMAEFDAADAAAPRIGTPQHFRWLLGVVKVVLVLNLLDAMLTLYWVRGGLATEANTLIDELVSQSAIGFIAIKLSLVGMGSWLLWNRRHHPFAVIGIFAIFVCYYLILLHHLQFLSRLVRHSFGLG